ncbi:outer membrane protein assembly factor BamE [Ponticoccus litoralis]|uniref:Outer membrane protein assembly factor BamE n=1 Tax=Ponticoccus litoralis TaxID=422297 RepID=A0AAW9SQZ1_9RHOB
MQGKTGRARLAAATVMVVALGACSASYRTHGYMPPEDELQQIVPGVDTQASVEDLIGVPNASGVRDNSGFYYIETEMRHFAWRRPEIMDRQILAITFDQAGIVDNISTYGLEDEPRGADHPPRDQEHRRRDRLHPQALRQYRRARRQPASGRPVTAWPGPRTGPARSRHAAVMQFAQSGAI